MEDFKVNDWRRWQVKQCTRVTPPPNPADLPSAATLSCSLRVGWSHGFALTPPPVALLRNKWKQEMMFVYQNTPLPLSLPITHTLINPIMLPAQAVYLVILQG